MNDFPLRRSSILRRNAESDSCLKKLEVRLFSFDEVEGESCACVRMWAIRNQVSKLIDKETEAVLS